MLLSLISLVWRFCLISRHTNPFFNAKSLSFATVLYGPMSLCNVFWRFGCCFVCFWLLFCFVLCVFLFGRVSVSFCIVTAYWTVYWSFFSTTFAAHHPTRWINYNTLINGTCCMPIERVDRPGESQEATGGKK